MTAPYCLVYGYPADESTCPDCSKPFDTYVAPYVSVGRLDQGRLCDDCAERSGLDDLASGLNALDTYVLLNPAGTRQAAAGLNVQQALRYLLDERWLPMVLAAAAGDDL